ncbi:hypothetical protein MJO29_011533 [Puccinia striiformis f. sp. tritici]|uniref:hypothetical protein n=1 Tax=Puccinia striiformis f. sp. tritici TaxID=168172 RepID=UPI0020076323|nr:hypothetical protein Pst134EA_021348 [Puccinia striiformis f. sp. tritici]KAH9457472.1 hypothetical protein Pst134EA_021348 [Puccinia striiformis f. sp. tritici]KAI7947006.1 hypothetical protein MJO29_011533 [Puccinia striiformis f. sp. tritici]
MLILASFSAARCLCRIAWCVAFVTAPDPFKVTSALWDESRSYDARPPPAQHLLSILSSRSRLELNQPQSGSESSRAALLHLLRPESPGSPSQWPGPIPTTSSFLDVSSKSALFTSKTNEGQSAAPPIQNPKPTLYTSKRNEGQSAAPPIQKFRRLSPSSHLSTISDSLMDDSPDSTLISTIGREAHSKSPASLVSNPTSGHPAQQPYPSDLKSTADKFNHHSHGNQSPFPVDRSANEIPQIISSDGSESRQETSHPLAAAAATLLNEQLALKIDSREREPEATTETGLYAELKNTGPKFLTDNGKLYVSLLKDDHEEFRSAIQSVGSMIKGVPDKKRYSGASFVMVHRPKALGWSYRVLNTDDNIQPPSNMIVVHKSLIKWIYMVHTRRLNQLNIPGPVQYSRQREMLDWLREQLYTYLEGAPIVGVRKSLNPEWEEGETLGATKLILIKLFSRKQHDHRVSFSTACELINIFNERYPFNFPKPSRPLQNIQQITTDPYFETRMQFLLTLDGGNIEGYAWLFGNRPVFPGDDNLIRSHIELFTAGFLPGPKLKNQFLSPHPTLPIFFYHLKETPGFGYISTFKIEEREMLRADDVAVYFKRLLRAANYIHIEVLRHLGVGERDILARRRAFLKWMHDIFLQPQIDLPTIGKIKLRTPGLAPWEDASYGYTDLFTPMQLNLFEFMSSKMTPLSLKTHATFAFSTWYQRHYSTEFRSLI